MNLELLKEFKDPYMKTPEGQGAFLSGVLLGYIAYRQVAPSREEGASKGSSAQGIDKSPLFKQIQFGRLDGRSLKRLLARVPQLIAAYGESLSGVSGCIAPGFLDTGLSIQHSPSVSLPPPGRRKVLATPQAAFCSPNVL